MNTTETAPPGSLHPVVSLFPCPFDGGEAVLKESHRDHWHVECKECGARRGNPTLSPIMAATDWNYRALPADVVSVLEDAAAYDTGEQPCIGADAKLALSKWQANDKLSERDP